MTRRRWYLAATAAASVGLGAIGIAWASGQRHQVAQPTEIRNLWQWELGSVPTPPRGGELQIVVREQVVPTDDHMPGHPSAALRSGEGNERVVWSEALGPGESLAGRVSLELLDIRELGVAVRDDAPLRLRIGVAAEGSRNDVVMRLAGHSVRGLPLAHGDSWQRNERPLLTVATVDQSRHSVTTVLLQVSR